MRYTFAWADEYDAAKDYRGGVVLEVMGIKAWYPCISRIYKRFGNPDPHKLAALLKSGEKFSIYTSKGELEGCRVRRNGGICD